MKKNVFYLLFLGFVIGCKESVNHLINPKIQFENFGNDIKKTKKWFETEFLEKNKNSRMNNNGKKYEHNLQWEFALNSKFDENTPLIIVPIKTKINGKDGNKNTVAWIYEDMNKVKTLKVVDYSLIDKNKKMNLFNFSGLMVLREFNGDLIDGYVFENNKAISIIDNIDKEEPKWKVNKKNGKLNTTYCYNLYNVSMTCIDYYYINCVQVVNMNALDCTPPNYNGSVCTLNYSNVVDCSWAQNVSTGGNSTPTTGYPNSTNNSFNGYPVSPGKKPISIFPNKCQGLSDIWQRSINSNPKSEINGVLTANGEFLITEYSGYTGGAFNGLYKYNSDLYYTFPDDGTGQPNISGIFKAGNNYYVKISATVHTHTPCLNDGTNGIDGQSTDDRNFATFYQGFNVNHYVIGCNAMGQFSSTSNGYNFNKHYGLIGINCTYIN